jgi:hypothetical protein
MMATVLILLVFLCFATQATLLASNRAAQT